MFRYFLAFIVPLATCLSNACYSGCYGGCCQSFEVGVGWRRDYIKWHAHRIEASTPLSSLAVARSDFDFDHVESYMLYSKLRWIGEAFYIRLATDFGWTFKGQGEECFFFESPLFREGQPVRTRFGAGIKRRSEVWDITGAVGYPFSFCCRRMYVVPLLGFSYHRQRLRVKAGDDPLETSSCGCHDGSTKNIEDDLYQFIETTSDSSVDSSFEIFSVDSVPPIEAMGFEPCELRGSTHRFTWYGFFIGLDAAYAFDCSWTLFTELEWHFYDNAHRKRDSHTSVAFVDDYHKDGAAHGFNGTVGATVGLCDDWYATFTVDFKWWRSKEGHDTLTWNSVGANAAIGLSF